MTRLRPENGFILAATIWLLAGMALAAGFFALWAEKTLRQAYDSKADLQGEIDMANTQATLLYLLATQSLTVGGLTVPNQEQIATPPPPPTPDAWELGMNYLPQGTEIALDDRVYQGLGRTLFAIQDEGGLVGLAFGLPRPRQLENLLGILGVPAERRGPLMDKLYDYTDKSPRKRLNGANREDYLHRGLPPPPNRPLLTSWEIKNIMDWPGEKTLWEPTPLPRLVTMAHGALPNPNTAPKLVLLALDMMDAETAERIIVFREKITFPNLAILMASTGKMLPYDETELRFFPAEHLRLSMWSVGSSRFKEIHVELTPSAGKIQATDSKTMGPLVHHAPWLMDYELTLPLPPTWRDLKADQIKTVVCPLFSQSDQ